MAEPGGADRLGRHGMLPRHDAPLQRTFALLGDAVTVATNDERVLAAAQASFGGFGDLPGGSPITLHVVVDAGAQDRGPLWHRYAAGRYVVSGSGGLAVADLRTSTALAFVGPELVASESVLRYTFLEGPALALMTACRGYISLHASGVALNDRGIALVGAEGAGKSTLAVAAARRGLEVFAEDAVFIRSADGSIEFWGMPWVQRLLPDAGGHFPELSSIAPRRQANGELKLEVALNELYPGTAVKGTRPAAIIVLDRVGPEAAGRTEIAPLDAAALVASVELQWPWTDAEWTSDHDAAEQLLRRLPAYRLTMGGTPDAAIDAVELLFERLPAPG